MARLAAESATVRMWNSFKGNRRNRKSVYACVEREFVEILNSRRKESAGFRFYGVKRSFLSDGPMLQGSSSYSPTTPSPLVA